jgi:PAS domain S-box-containing protein
LYLKRYLKDGVARVMGKNRELPARKKDETEFMVELGVTEIKTDSGDRLFCGFVRDLTQQKIYESELKRREAFTNKIIESSRDGVFVMTHEGNISRVNSAAVALFGRERDEMVSKCFFDMLSPPHAHWLKEEMENYIFIGLPITPQRQVDALGLDGSIFTLNLSLAELEGQDGSALFACFVE